MESDLGRGTTARVTLPEASIPMLQAA